MTSSDELGLHAKVMGVSAAITVETVIKPTRKSTIAKIEKNRLELIRTDFPLRLWKNIMLF